MATHKAKATRKATRKANNQVHKNSAKRVHSKKTKKATRKSRQATSKSRKATSKSHKATRKSRRHQKGGVGAGEASRVLASQTASSVDPFGRKVHAVASAISSIF